MWSRQSGFQVESVRAGIVIDWPTRRGQLDSREFVGFYQDNFDGAARLGYLLTGDLATGEDLAQEALARVESRFAKIDHPNAYLRAVLVNLASRTQVRRDRDRRLRQRLGPPAAEASPAQELNDVIDALPSRQRIVIILRYYDDLTEAEIAEVLGCRPGTVKSLSSRALATLRRELADD